MSDEGQPRHILYVRSYCGKRRERPLSTCGEDLQENLEQMHVTGWKSITSNRMACKRIVTKKKKPGYHNKL